MTLGDSVRVVEGEYKGKFGLVIHIKEFLFGDRISVKLPDGEVRRFDSAQLSLLPRMRDAS